MADLSKEWDEASPDLSSDWDAAAPVQPEYTAPSAPKTNLGLLGSSAINRGLASAADAFLNTPTNIANLGIAGLGSLAVAAGRPEFAPQPIQQPNFAARGMRAAGIETSPQAQTVPQRIVERGLEYAAGSVVSPSTGARQAASNIFTGGLSGVAGSAVEQATGSEGAGALASLVAPAALAGAAQRGSRAMAQNATKDQIAAAAREAGYKLPPSMTGASLPARAVEGLSGRITMNQTASRRNEEVTNRLAARAAGLPQDQLNPAGLTRARQESGAAYEALRQQPAFAVDARFRQDIQRLGADNAQMRQNLPALANDQIDTLLAQVGGANQFDAPAAVNIIRQLRADAKRLYRGTDPGGLEQAAANRGIANALEGLIERRLAATGNVELLQNFRASRQRYAVVESIDAAMNEAGEIDPQVLARMLANGEPLSGPLLTIARTANVFPKAMQKPTGQQDYPLSKLDYGLTAGGLGLSGLGAVDPTTALAVGVAPVAAREAMLSPVYQRFIAPNNYLFTRAAQNANTAGVTAANALQLQRE